ncbi:MAG: TolC family protein, partial [Acidobacteria bacterium]|nr:TolC family protein [Acidobacteriota bacterium]
MKQFYRKFYYAILFTTVLLYGLGNVSAQTAAPTPTPQVSGDLKPVDDNQDVAPDKLKGVPPIAAGYKSDDKKLPELGRVGVDMLSQRPLGLREAIVKALENNKDIEVSRKDVKIAEYDLLASEGNFSARITGNTYYERASLPNVSIFNRNPATTNTSLVADIGYQGFVKDFGTSYSFTFKNRRSTTDNPVSVLSPQFDSSFEFKVVQPLFRGRRSDDARRGIELSRQNLSITDKQF